MIQRIPGILYKYVPFNANSLQLLSEGQLYYSNPCQFNDPLDSKPTIDIDTDCSSIEKLYFKMVETTQGNEFAKKSIKNLRYLSTEVGDYKTDSRAENYYIGLMKPRIMQILENEMASHGVLSLTTRWDSVLMWSHYADAHRGLCLGYDTADNSCAQLNPVNYKSPRSIRVSELIRWKLHDSYEAERAIFRTYFYTKSYEWRYEKEWRDIYKSNGHIPSTLNLNAVYFGLKCNTAVRTAVVKLFSNTSFRIRFYNIYLLDENFVLKRSYVDTEEIEKIGVSHATYLAFSDVSNECLDNL